MSGFKGKNSAFIRKKTVGPYTYHQIVHNKWHEGSPHQKVLLHIGQYSDADAAEKGWSKELKDTQRSIQEGHSSSELQARAHRLKKDLTKLKRLRDEGHI